jgi:hypothetical protein
MTARAADARFLVPGPVRRVALVGTLDGWAGALELAGVTITDDAPDLVVAPRADASAAARVGADTVLIIGAARRALTKAGYHPRTVVVRHGRHGPRLYVPADARLAARHALTAPEPGRARWKQAAARAVLAAAERGLPVTPVLTVGSRKPGTPAFLAAAAPVAPTDDWYLVSGEGDDLQRLVWFCFDGAPEPASVVKCSRVLGNVAPFDRDLAALALLDDLPAELRRHAPRVLARFDVDGLPASVETAAPGRPLHTVLRGAGDAARTRIDAVCEWIVAVGRATQLPAERLEPERERLARDVLPAWTPNGAPPALVASFPSVRPVLQHNDLGCWNILADADTFTVVDWESARRAGLPLWDLVYFLADACSAMNGAADATAKEQAVLDVLRGRLPSSALLFEWVARAAESAGVAPDAVGPIVTLGWLHHGLSSLPRAAARRAHAGDAAAVAPVGPLERVAEYWLRDPDLGVDWAAFVAWRTRASAGGEPVA